MKGLLILLAASMFAVFWCAPLLRAGDIPSEADSGESIDFELTVDSSSESANQVLELPQRCDDEALAARCATASASSSDSLAPGQTAAASAVSSGARGAGQDSGIADDQYGSIDDYQREYDSAEAPVGMPTGSGPPLIVMVPGPSYVSPAPVMARPWVAPSAVYGTGSYGPGSSPRFISPITTGVRFPSRSPSAAPFRSR